MIGTPMATQVPFQAGWYQNPAPFGVVEEEPFDAVARQHNQRSNQPG